MFSRLRRRQDERGAIILLTSVGIVVAMIAGGLAIDAGVRAAEARNDQRVADLAALDGVRALPSDPTPAAQQSATRNKFPFSKPGYQLSVLWNDPATGVMRHADAGYDLAIACAREHGLDLPMLNGDAAR